MQTPFKLTFLGGVGTVTGSKYLLEINNNKLLIDCGLFQGLKELRLRNWAALPIPPRTIDQVILTHAHLDHSGYVPLLVKNGFEGQVYCTPATRDLCSILLPDSGYLQEEQAAHANRHGYSKHTPALPLYTREDAEVCLRQFKAVPFDQPHPLDRGVTVTFKPAGHILGASLIELAYQGKTILFSGDLGRLHDPVMNPPVAVKKADYLILESTYGDRLHEKTNPLDQLKNIINRTVKRGGKLLIPSFAVGRAQTLLYLIYQLKAAKEIPNIPVYIDSPMTIDATQLFLEYVAEHRLSKEECLKTCQGAHYVHTADESQRLDLDPKPAIIISASGMATGGRILHHLKTFAPDPKNTLLFTGYQAAGTRGADIIQGKKDIKMLGEMVPIRAEVCSLHNVSAHADYQETLEWLKHFTTPPKQVFITHGEPAAAKALKAHIESSLGWKCLVPNYLEVFYGP